MKTDTYRWDGQEHDHERLLTQDGMLDQLIGKPHKATTTFLKET
jgi:hypothetical protein